jgi:biopolymer transport protein ExbB
MVSETHAFFLALGAVFVTGVLAGPTELRAQDAPTPAPAPALEEAKTGDPAGGSTAGPGPDAALKPAGGPAAARPGVDRSSIFGLLLHANPMLWPLAICSIVTLGYVMERLAALRRERVIPQEFAERFLERLSSGKLDRERAIELCRAHESPLARVFSVVVSAWGQPGLTIRQVVSHDGAGEVVELKRNLRVLSAMSTLGPLLGLLGTVVGIIQSFDALGGRLGPARGEALAKGISLALVATAFGLAIAIVSVAFYYYFLNRVDVLVRELDERTRQVIELVASESHRLPPLDRRHGSIGTGETHRQESRVL